MIVKTLKDLEAAKKSHEVQTLKDWQILIAIFFPISTYKIEPDFLKLREGNI